MLERKSRARGVVKAGGRVGSSFTGGEKRR